jgi:predicted  nucleic acid-binding Zn-ribbon protein
MQAKKLEERINKAKDKVFAAFSKAVGVKKWREHEAKLDAQIAAAEARSRELRGTIAENSAEEERLRTALHEAGMKLEREQAALAVRHLHRTVARSVLL